LLIIAREIILADYLSRRFQNCIIESHKPLPTANKGHSGFNTPKLGSVKIHPCGEAVLPRTSCSVIAKDMKIKFRFFVSLPARGRNILGDRAAFMLCDEVTDIIQTIFKGLDLKDLNEFIRTVETQEYLRNSLDRNGLVAFIANGSILPRGSGVTDKPLANAQAVPFKSPPEYEVAISTPYSGAITGMGIPYGVTVITGGGFHGKSTLLEALQKWHLQLHPRRRP
jgi:predicted ABC-class ATPase